MPEERSAVVTKSRPAPSVARSALAAGVGGLLVLVALVALRFGALSLGLVLHRSINHAHGAALLLPAMGVAGSMLGALVTAAVVAWLRVGPMPWVIGLLGAIAIAVPRWLASIPVAVEYDFHGVLTLAPSQRFPEFSPLRPPIEYRIDRFGFRGPDWSEAKQPGTVRVVTLGDSFVFGMGVEEKDTLAAQLSARLAERGIAGVEVLNLGLAGSNLPTHIRMLDLARRVLAADVVVMGLFVWNDLASWDCEDEKARRSQPGWFSALAWLLGDEPAVVLLTMTMVQHGNEARSLAVLDSLLPSLRAARDKARPGPEVPPLIVNAYNATPEVRARFAHEPDLVFLDAPRDPAFYIPVDGHPSAAGNRAFSFDVLTAMLALPPLHALAPR